MSYSDWIEYRFSDIVEIIGGGTPKTKVTEYWGGNIPWLSVVDFNNDQRHVFATEKTITEEGLAKSSTKILNVGDTIISARGTVGAIAQMFKPMAFNQSCYGIRAKEEIVLKDFIYYLLKHNVDVLKSNTHGSVFDTITKSTFESMFVKIPMIQEQKAIANILSSLDDKIELNNKINKNLEEMAQTLYKRWFVDFEFPNENGEPYKSSGGEMVESELGLIPKGWEVKRQGVYFPVLTGKKNANVATQNGKYKFFTCSQQILKTDDFSFDGDAILIAGNGDFNVKYYSGKFEAYQRTYVLIPHNNKLSGLLFTAIKYNLKNITTGFRGSVINFITKGHIDDYKIAFPDDSQLERMSVIFKNILKNIANNDNQNEKLSQTRDELLPKLMSGEIEVPLKENLYGN